MTSPPDPRLRARLEALYSALDGASLRQDDPVSFVHRYDSPRDQEIAALLASSLAYGRVSLFFPVLTQVFTLLDAHGGPAAFVANFERSRAEPLRGLVYRWNRGRDLIWLLGGLHELLANVGTLESVFEGAGGVKTRLTAGVERLRAAVLQAARVEERFTSFRDLPRGTKYMLPSPSSGSACKRWHMFLRWMVRTSREGVDLGIWRSFDPSELLMPVDVHVARIARLVGLTERQDATWRTVEDITANLRRIDPADPVRFDFAIAHLGISGGCTGGHHVEVCPPCPLHTVCTATPRA